MNTQAFIAATFVAITTLGTGWAVAGEATCEYPAAQLESIRLAGLRAVAMTMASL